MENAVFRDVAPCGSCKNRRFWGTQRLHHQGDKNRRTRNVAVTSNRRTLRRFLQEPHGVTSQKTPFFSFSCYTNEALSFTQPLTERSTTARNKRKCFWGVKGGMCVRLDSPPSVSRLSTQCRILKTSQSYRPPRPVKEIALLFFYFMYIILKSCSAHRYVSMCQSVPQIISNLLASGMWCRGW
jgi:hypothetical protein